MTNSMAIYMPIFQSAVFQLFMQIKTNNNDSYVKLLDANCPIIGQFFEAVGLNP